jgi:hypothetical protein
MARSAPLAAAAAAAVDESVQPMPSHKMGRRCAIKRRFFMEKPALNMIGGSSTCGDANVVCGTRVRVSRLHVLVGRGCTNNTSKHAR